LLELLPSIEGCANEALKIACSKSSSFGVCVCVCAWGKGGKFLFFSLHAWVTPLNLRSSLEVGNKHIYSCLYKGVGLGTR